MLLSQILQNLSLAKRQMAGLGTDAKSAVLHLLADRIEENVAFIQKENKRDLEQMDPADSKYDRLLLSAERIQNLANSLRKVAQLPDPANTVVREKVLANGLILSKLQVPLGAIGVIYESRPNVTVDVAALCLHSGNVCILKGGKEADYSNKALVYLIHQVLEEKGISKDAVILLPALRTYTEELLKAKDLVDVIIPRGSENLIQYVRKTSLIPTIETGAGVCHTYVECSANPKMAAEIIVNAKVSRPSVCNALDTALIDEVQINLVIPLLVQEFEQAKVEVYADNLCYQVFEGLNYPYLKRASEDDFGKEWLGYKASFKAVNGLEEALQHIEKYSSKHSEAIVTNDLQLAETFLQSVDAAAVYHNASTRFTDGEVFELGAEIGISTQKLHARGPFALEKLVTEKWVLRGSGQIR